MKLLVAHTAASVSPNILWRDNVLERAMGRECVCLVSVSSRVAWEPNIALKGQVAGRTHGGCIKGCVLVN